MGTDTMQDTTAKVDENGNPYVELDEKKQRLLQTMGEAGGYMRVVPEQETAKKMAIARELETGGLAGMLQSLPPEVAQAACAACLRGTSVASAVQDAVRRLESRDQQRDGRAAASETKAHRLTERGASGPSASRG